MRIGLMLLLSDTPIPQAAQKAIQRYQGLGSFTFATQNIDGLKQEVFELE